MADIRGRFAARDCNGGSKPAQSGSSARLADGRCTGTGPWGRLTWMCRAGNIPCQRGAGILAAGQQTKSGPCSQVSLTTSPHARPDLPCRSRRQTRIPALLAMVPGGSGQAFLPPVDSLSSPYRRTLPGWVRIRAIHAQGNADRWNGVMASNFPLAPQRTFPYSAASAVPG